jgi:hypothetical protein
MLSLRPGRIKLPVITGALKASPDGSMMVLFALCFVFFFSSINCKQRKEKEKSFVYWQMTVPFSEK